MPHRNEIALYELAPPGNSPPVPGFALSRVTAMTVGLPDTGTPHRHDYHEMLLVEHGGALHTIDGQAYQIGGGQAALIGQGRVHLMLQTMELTGWIVRFEEALLLATPGTAEAAVVAELFSPLAVSQTLELAMPEIEACSQLAALMADELANPERERVAAVVRHLLHALLLRLARSQRAPGRDDRLLLPEYRVYQEFLLVLERDFRTHHEVQHYEAALGLGGQRLSRALARAVGKPAKQLIAERLTLEAKRLLTYTSRSVKEIAHELGFSDQFRFSKAFKAQTGVPPLAFRER